MQQYENLSLIYDKMIDVDYEKWESFIVGYLNSKGIFFKGKKALELGCGTGNMTLRLKRAGMDLTALDISDEMLSIAQEKALDSRCRIVFLNQDMTDFKIDRTFDFVFSFCDGYNYVTDEAKLRQSFSKVYDHMYAGGYFIFDISTPYKLEKVIGNNTFTMNREELCYIWDNYFEGDMLEMYITFFTPEGRLFRRFEERHLQRAYGTDFIVECLKGAGFNNIEVFEDYTLANISEKSIRATFTAKK